MKKLNMHLPFKLAAMAPMFFTITTNATEVTAVEPPMVSIPAGSYFMGSDKGAPNEQPVRKVDIAAFQVGKYEVTYAEFKQFARATNFTMEANCYQYVLGGPNRKKYGTWNNNIYQFGDYYPVVCISVDTAKEYAQWLSTQTGKHYRLPTEAEWEYVARGGTNSYFAFGSEQEANKACEYGNISDWYAGDKSAELFEGAYVAEIEKCNDNEATLSVVGLYKPNQYGVYDMVGNAMEYLQDCYVDNYNNAPTDGSAVLLDDCKEIVVRGGSWHWFPWRTSKRYALPLDGHIGALEGIRLVLDTKGKSLPASQGTASFVKNLQKAQQKTKAKHNKMPDYPNIPEGLQILTSSSKKIELRWQPNVESWVTGYKVYRHDPLSNEKVAISNLLTKTKFTDNNPLPYNARYYVVAFNGNTKSQASNSIDTNFKTIHALPKLVQGEAYALADNPDVKLSGLEPENDKIIVSLNDRFAEYTVETKAAQSFKLNARVFHSGGKQEFKIWLGDRLVINKQVEGERGWKTLKGMKIQLPKGKSQLRVKGENDLFAINWLNFTI